MHELWMVSVPVMLAAILAAMGGVFVELHDHNKRLASLEAKMDLLLSGHRGVDYGANP